MSWSVIGLIISVGAALSVLFYWLCIMFRVTDTKRGVVTWIKIFFPQGVLIAWALWMLEII